ncbi:MAG: hypothetical protein ISN29_02445 [Gammaproteobacteria bacterium AqS3]|nr:hypothetical protein [Gammaproteobacteria bacterium AqS3]
MPYKDPAKQKEAMKVIRKRYDYSVKGYNNRMKSRVDPRAKAKEAQKRKQCNGSNVRITFYDTLREDQGGRCAYCDITLRKNGGQVDRVIPGVPYSTGNCVLACAECNMHKRNSDVNAFLDDLCEQGLIPPGLWVMPGGRYHRPDGEYFKPNPQYEGSLSQDLPEKEDL